ncbi:hypothetical protein [Haloarcula laminariae]|uniref:hypothetical protein n=1 Tax=Haloarcula laminariae TaxID=2961577 RepID=UPI002404D4A7|nr:hypothetical protein [Halomicroarcula sp. FL173]
MNRPVVYHGSMAVVGLTIAANGVGTLLEPGTSDLAGVLAIVGGGLLCATSGYTLADGATEEVSAGATRLVALAAVLSTVGVALTYLN